MYHLIADSDTSTVKKGFDALNDVLYWYNKLVVLKAECVMIWFILQDKPLLLTYHINKENK